MAKKTSSKAARAANPTFDLKTKEGRDALDEAVAGKLRGLRSPMLGKDLLAGFGSVTPVQLRTSLARLVDAGKVQKTGVTRNTTYALA